VRDPNSRRAHESSVVASPVLRDGNLSDIQNGTCDNPFSSSADYEPSFASINRRHAVPKTLDSQTADSPFPEQVFRGFLSSGSQGFSKHAFPVSNYRVRNPTTQNDLSEDAPFAMGGNA
jgi:hypothetical protein